MKQKTIDYLKKELREVKTYNNIAQVPIQLFNDIIIFTQRVEEEVEFLKYNKIYDKKTTWIDINDRLPSVGKTILVLGKWNCELEDISVGYESIPHQYGIVKFDRINYSPCVNICYYSMWFSDITHYIEIFDYHI